MEELYEALEKFWPIQDAYVDAREMVDDCKWARLRSIRMTEETSNFYREAKEKLASTRKEWKSERKHLEAIVRKAPVKLNVEYSAGIPDQRCIYIETADLVLIQQHAELLLRQYIAVASHLGKPGVIHEDRLRMPFPITDINLLTYSGNALRNGEPVNYIYGCRDSNDSYLGRAHFIGAELAFAKMSLQTKSKIRQSYK